MTKILKCECSHSFQDGKYGVGRRLHNPTTREGTWRCTVCSSDNRVGSLSTKKGKK